jgi:hypothetical protein
MLWQQEVMAMNNSTHMDHIGAGVGSGQEIHTSMTSKIFAVIGVILALVLGFVIQTAFFYIIVGVLPILILMFILYLYFVHRAKQESSEKIK